MSAAMEPQVLVRKAAGAPPAAVAAQTLAAWRAGPGAFLILGFASTSIPASGSIRGRDAARPLGIFRCASWPGRRTDDAGRQAVLTAVRLLDGGPPQNGAFLPLHGESGETLALPMPPALADDEAFGQQVARIAGPRAPQAARFMLTMLRPREDRHDPRIGAGLARMLRAFLTEAAAKDGCIEIMTATPNGCVLLQGWGAPLLGPVEVLLAGEAMPWFSGHAGEFERPDIASPATGVMLALPPQAASTLNDVDHVFVISDRGIHARALVDRRLLGPAESAGHIRHMSPRLRCQGPMRAWLEDAVRPRYDGRDTLAGSKRPVRAAIDFAAAAPEAGVFLAGWVFDPERQIASIHLCGTKGLAAPIDESWVRIARPDVIASFQQAPGFPPSRDGDAGFSVAVQERLAADEALYLQFTFTGGDRAFLPLTAAALSDPVIRARLLKDIDLFKPSGRPILDRHVAPLLARIQPAADLTARVHVEGPTGRKHAIVVPLAAGQLPRALVSGFLHDPPDDMEQIVFVCGTDWEQSRLDALRALTAFHDLPASILMMAGTPEPVLALREAARIASADTFLIVAAGLSARPGWRRALRALAGGAAFACPTILYEDWSIRYAGFGELSFHDTAPFARVRMSMAGLSGTLAVAAEPAPTSMGSLACCLIPRVSLTTANGPGAFATCLGAEADFFAQLHAAGHRGVWAPAIQVHASEDLAPTAIAGQIADGWILRSKWRPERKG